MPKQDGERDRNKRRVRSPHPGVTLRKRAWKSGATAWYGRWRDPDSGRELEAHLGKLRVTSAETRRKWAIAKSKDITAREYALERGEARLTETSLRSEWDAFLTTARGSVRPRTVGAYEDVCGPFIDWLETVRHIEFVEQIDRRTLSAYRNLVIAQPKSRPTVDAPRGTREPTDDRRAPATINRVLRHAKALVNHWRMAGLVPLLHRDAISEALRGVEQEGKRADPLQPSECVKLIEAAICHDAARFKLTRREHQVRPSAKTAWGTPRYVPVAPLVAFVLLTGCRIGEALSLRWDDVHLEAIDMAGRVVGEVLLEPSATKTKLSRRIDLAVSPMLRALLVRLHAQNGVTPYVFGGTAPLSNSRAVAARRRLIDRFDGPVFTWQRLRVSCACYLTNAPAIFGGSSIFRSAEQLGHSPLVAHKHYLGVMRGIPHDARTLEDAMGIRRVLERLVDGQTPGEQREGPAR